MIKARRLEDWLTDWLERNSELKVLHDSGEVFYDYYGSNSAFSVARLAEDLAVALAEEGLEHDRPTGSRSNPGPHDDQR